MAVETGCTKEATILGLSEEIKKALVDLESNLDNRFRRTPLGVKKEDRPECSNVLDEIICNLQDDLQLLRQIAIFVSNEVLPKIN